MHKGDLGILINGLYICVGRPKLCATSALGLWPGPQKPTFHLHSLLLLLLVLYCEAFVYGPQTLLPIRMA